jgi:hypothetical protein
MTEPEQPGFDPRMEWSAEGPCCSRGSARWWWSWTCCGSRPRWRWRWPGERRWSRGAGRRVGGRRQAAVCPRAQRPAPIPTPGPLSLSPASLLGVAAGTPGGAGVAERGHGRPGRRRGRRGWCWPGACATPRQSGRRPVRSAGRSGWWRPGSGGAGGALRPALEDLVGAGAVLHAAGSSGPPVAGRAVAEAGRPSGRPSLGRRRRPAGPAGRLRLRPRAGRPRPRRRPAPWRPSTTSARPCPASTAGRSLSSADPG